MNAADTWATPGGIERFMSQSLASVPVGVVLLDHEGRFRYLNPYFLRLLGRDAEDLLGRTLRELDEPLLPIETRERMARRVERRVSTGESITDEEIDMLRADGEVIPVCYSASGIFDDDGNVVGEVVFVADNSERQRAVRAIEDLEARQRALIDNAEIWLAVLAPSGRVVLWNRTAERLSGYARDEVIGHARIWERLYPDRDYRDDVMELVRHRVLERGEVVRNHETKIRTRDGDERFMAWTVRGLSFPDGGASSLLVVGQDLTEKRQMEASLAHSDRLASLGALAGGVAHEINNPLSIVLNCVELSRDDVEPGSELAENLHDIAEASQRIATIVRDLLSFARADSQFSATAGMDELLTRTASLVTKLLQRDHIRLEIETPPHLPQVRCRPDQIQQVLMNLLTNARDALNARYPGAHPDKAIRIGVGILDAPDGRWLRTTVEDRGAGIPARFLDRIFDPFFTSKARDQGTGLGLSVSHGIVAEHRGRLLVESDEGVFARFHLDLPIEGPTLGKGIFASGNSSIY